MKKYTRPTVEVVELSVKESLSALPKAFGGTEKQGFSFRMGTVGGTRNVSIYTYNSALDTTKNQGA